VGSEIGFVSDVAQNVVMLTNNQRKLTLSIFIFVLWGVVEHEAINVAACSEFLVIAMDVAVVLWRRDSGVRSMVNTWGCGLWELIYVGLWVVGTSYAWYFCYVASIRMNKIK